MEKEACFDIQEVGSKSHKVAVLIPGVFISCKLHWETCFKLILDKWSAHLVIFNHVVKFLF
jgi:hypothetical protein